MVNIIVAGGAGRMGRRIIDLATKDEKCEISGAFECAGHPAVGSSLATLVSEANAQIKVAESYLEIVKEGDFLIDFTSPEVTLKNLAVAAVNNKKMVIGTTGFTFDQEAIIKKTAEVIPIVFAPNMSVGVNLLFKISQMVASVLGDDYDIEIVEAHHKYKKDAPSGTALGLAKQVVLGRKVDFNEKVIYGREGLCGERKKGEIGVHAIRGGDVVGDHTVSFMTDGERIELTHKASSRDAFAKGAIFAAKFLENKEKGLFSMQDVLGLN